MFKEETQNEFEENLILFLDMLRESPSPDSIKKYDVSDVEKILNVSDDQDESYYIPIGVLQNDLDRIFSGLWQWRNVVFSSYGNKVHVSGELWVAHPVLLQYPEYRTGSDFYICKTGSGAAQGEKANAVFPIAESFAFKNACKKLGARFGRDLNRDDVTASKKPLN